MWDVAASAREKKIGFRRSNTHHMKHTLLFLSLVSAQQVPCTSIESTYQGECCPAPQTSYMTCPAECYYDILSSTTETLVSSTTETFRFVLSPATDAAETVLVYLGSGESFPSPFSSAVLNAELVKQEGPLKARTLGNVDSNIVIASIQPAIPREDFTFDFVTPFGKTIDAIRASVPTATRVVMMSYSLGSIFVMSYLNASRSASELFDAFDEVYIQSPSLIPAAMGSLGIGFSEYRAIFEAFSSTTFVVQTHESDSMLGPTDMNMGWGPGDATTNLQTLQDMDLHNLHTYVLDGTVATVSSHALSMHLYEQGATTASVVTNTRAYIPPMSKSFCENTTSVLSYVHMNASLAMSKGFRYDFDCAAQTMEVFTIFPEQEANMSALLNNATTVHSMDQNKVLFGFQETSGIITIENASVGVSDWILNYNSTFQLEFDVNIVSYPGFRVKSAYQVEIIEPPSFYHDKEFRFTDTYDAQRPGTLYTRVA